MSSVLSVFRIASVLLEWIAGAVLVPLATCISEVCAGAREAEHVKHSPESYHCVKRCELVSTGVGVEILTHCIMTPKTCLGQVYGRTLQREANCV